MFKTLLLHKTIATKDRNPSIHIRIALFQKFISPGELDPLNRRQVTETKPEVVVQGKHCSN